MALEDDLLTALNDEGDQINKLEVLTDHLADLIKQGQSDPAKLQQALDLVTTHKQKLIDAVTRDTPAP